MFRPRRRARPSARWLPFAPLVAPGFPPVRCTPELSLDADENLPAPTIGTPSKQGRRNLRGDDHGVAEWRRDRVPHEEGLAASRFGRGVVRRRSSLNEPGGGRAVARLRPLGAPDLGLGRLGHDADEAAIGQTSALRGTRRVTTSNYAGAPVASWRDAFSSTKTMVTELSGCQSGVRLAIRPSGSTR